MRNLVRQEYDKVCLGLALVAVGLSIGWCWWQRRDLPDKMTAPVMSGTGYVAGTWPAVQTAIGEWLAPPPQRGSGWRYEVFTPPAISYNEADGSFALVPTAQSAAPGETTAPSEGLAGRRQPYRLQLMGYLGEAGNYVAAFTSPLLQETLLARPGGHFAALGLTFRSLEVRRVIAGHNEAGPVWEVAAFAVLYDESSETEVLLDSRTRRLADTPPVSATVARSEPAISSP